MKIVILLCDLHLKEFLDKGYNIFLIDNIIDDFCNTKDCQSKICYLGEIEL